MMMFPSAVVRLPCAEVRYTVRSLGSLVRRSHRELDLTFTSYDLRKLLADEVEIFPHQFAIL